VFLPLRRARRRGSGRPRAQKSAINSSSPCPAVSNVVVYDGKKKKKTRSGFHLNRSYYGLHLPADVFGAR